MGTLMRGLMAATLIGLPCGTAHAAITGRYQASYFQRTGADFKEDLRNFLDLSTRTTLEHGYDVDVRINLRHRTEPRTPGTSLLTSRLHSRLTKGNSFRAFLDYSPWQDTSPGGISARNRNLRLKMETVPRRAPSLSVELRRRDHETAQGRKTHTQEGLARLAYSNGAWDGNLNYRRIETGPNSTEGYASQTSEVRGLLNARTQWGDTSLRTTYEGAYSTFNRGERDRETHSNRIQVNGSYRPRTNLVFGATSFLRLGKRIDNGLAGSQDIHERALTGRFDYLPFQGMSVSGIRTYRRQEQGVADNISDYWQVNSRYRRDVVRKVSFQLGVSRTEYLLSGPGNAPSNTLWTVLDGPIRRGIDLRTEFRVASDSRADSASTRWRSLVQLRTRPNRDTRLEVNWARSQAPEFLGRKQRDNAWEYLLAYRLSTALDLTGHYRTSRGEGRVDRREEFSSFQASWRFSSQTRLSTTLSRRDATTGRDHSRESAAGAHFTFRPAPDWRCRLTWNYTSSELRPSQSVYGLSAERNF